MTDDSDHCNASVEADGISHSESSIRAVLSELVTPIAEDLAPGEIPEPSPLDRTILFRLRFSLTDFIAERREHTIPATIGFTWMEFQELLAMFQALCTKRPGNAG
jgi:hypothetical protein